MLSVTKAAADKFNEISANKGKPDAMLRISFSGHGWGGPRMELSLDETTKKEDTIVKSEGVTVVFDKDLEYYVNGAVIDYSDEWHKRGFSLRGGSQSTC